MTNNSLKKKVEAHLQALRQILSKKKLSDEDIHKARQEIKKLRAIIKLIRTPLGKKYYGQYNGTLREIGKALGHPRDASVLPKSLEKLLIAESAQRKRSLQPTIDHLREYSASTVSDGKVALQPRAQQKKLQPLIDDLKKWPKLPPDFSALAKDLKKTYAHGKKLLAQNRTSSSSDSRHKLRKQAKNLRYQIRYLRDIWPAQQKMLEKALHDLSDLLGDDHDLTELFMWLKDNKKQLTASQSRILRGLITRRQNTLQQEALQLADLIYAEKAASFCRRQYIYWELQLDSSSTASTQMRQ